MTPREDAEETATINDGCDGKLLVGATSLAKCGVLAGPQGAQNHTHPQNQMQQQQQTPMYGGDDDDDNNNNNRLSPSPPPPPAVAMTAMMELELVSSPSQLRSVSALVDMEEVSTLLREDDADLLERHHSQTPNDATPLLKGSSRSQQPRPLPDVLFLPPPLSSSSSLASVQERLAGDASTTTTQSSMSPLLPSGQDSAEASQRPTLGGQVFDGASERQDSQQQAEAHKENCRLLETLDRRLNEAAQFAEAVGETKFGLANQLNILEEDHTDDDDEADEEELIEEKEEQKQKQRKLEGQQREQQGETRKAEEKERATREPAPLGQPLSTASDTVSAAARATVSATTAAAASENSVSKKSDPASLSPFPRGRGLRTSHKPLIQAQHKRKLTTQRGFLATLPTGQSSSESDFVYKGIRTNPPDICKRGIQRGNYAQLHRKAWLEVSDKYHRYGKNLRFYYRHWEALGCPTNMFFDWLDSKGEAAGEPLPEIEECPRAQLDSDTVLYITDPDVTENYGLTVLSDENGRGKLLDNVDGEPIVTGPDGWIFVLRDSRLYAAQKITSVMGHRSKQRFHHSSFFGGKAVAAAGIFITDDEGYLTRLYPHSGHYRPREAHMQRVLFYLHHEGVDLRTFETDLQQILHVARDKESNKKSKNEKNGNNSDSIVVAEKQKKAKVESLFLVPAVLTACFLAHKARFIGAGIFEQMHLIRKANVTTVTEALDHIDS